MRKIEVNRIYQGDMLRILKTFPDKCINLVFTSPPYNVGVSYKGYDDNKPFDEYIKWLESAFSECVRVLSGGGHLCVNIANTGRQPYLPITHYIGMRLSKIIPMRGEIIWDKQNTTAQTAWGSWLSPNCPSIRDSHEYILVFRKKGHRKGKSDITKKEFLEYTKSIWKVTSETKMRLHPAPFPVELAKRIIKLYSFIGEVVLDPFIGSGTTAIACVMLNRKFVGCEISPEYVRMAKERLKPVIEQRKLFSHPYLS